MTSSPASAEQDSESVEDYELGRITVLIGDVSLDVGVPTDVSIAAIVNDVVDLAADRLSADHGADANFENREGKLTFARLTGESIAPDLSLSEADVCDGEILLVRDLATPVSAALVDNVYTDGHGARRRGWASRRWAAGWLTLSMAFSVVVAAILRNNSGSAATPAEAAAALAVGFGCAATACVVALRPNDSLRSICLGSLGLSMIFGATLQVLPGAAGIRSLPMALALTALVALVLLLIGGHGRALYVAVIALACLAEPSALALLVWAPSLRTIGAILAMTAVVVVYLAPRATILLARLPIPRVPTAGEPLDEIETQGGTAVEGVSAIGKQIIPTEASLVEHVTRARDQLAGILSAAAVLAVVGCYSALLAGSSFSWQGTLFTIAVAAVLCLRGRSHHDLVQSATLIGAGLLIAVVVVLNTATYVSGWHVKSAVALSALMVLVAACGLVAPSVEFSPLSRRWTEILEFVAIVLVFPLACSIMNLYGIFRELRL